MIELKKRGFKIVVYTCRACIEKIRAYLEENEIPYDFINENPYEPEGVHPRKLYADLYIDDRAINFKDWESTLKAID
ncbi:MAG: hypothetical protein NZ894_05925, partial [Archaeoglobaceae archaeon]|nr:hypothetical protein [Archaeoglobaceae archaeon]